MKRRLIGIVFGLAMFFVLLPVAYAQGNPSGTGPPSQSCSSQPNSPGKASLSPGSPFNAGGESQETISSKTQYDVACYQLSNPPPF